MTRTGNSIFTFVLLLAIPFFGFGMMYSLIVYALPLVEDNFFLQSLILVGFILMGLAIPYGILKCGVHEARIWNWQEKEPEIKDIPKDKQQLAREHTPFA